jgi:hypothetical protein
MDKQISLVVTQEAEFPDISRNLTDMIADESGGSVERTEKNPEEA